jgi:UDP-N-acetylglucosamine 2-epimerase (non-hydrolysing)
VKKVMLVFGTRPEAIKMAPLALALQASPYFDPVVVVTAQHRRMLDQVLELFSITPKHDLDIMEDRQSLTGITARALEGISPLVASERPDAVVVQGDTTTSFVASLAAYYHQVPVVHLEAGLRTLDRYSPYPEETNRRLTTQLTTLHLAPTPSARSNLLAEGVDPASVVVTGNTVIDALLHTLGQPCLHHDAALASALSGHNPVLLVTAHRRESWDSGLASIGRALATLARAEPELVIAFPIHLNPTVRSAILPAVATLPNVRMLEPLAYGQFCHLMQRSHLVLTDSGGVQEEAPSLGKPVLVMRDKTERPEAIDAGVALLVGTGEQAIVETVRYLLHDDVAYAGMGNAINPYGDGRAAGRAVASLARMFGATTPVEEFDPSPRASGDSAAPQLGVPLD